MLATRGAISQVKRGLADSLRELYNCEQARKSDRKPGLASWSARSPNPLKSCDRAFSIYMSIILGDVLPHGAKMQPHLELADDVLDRIFLHLSPNELSSSIRLLSKSWAARYAYMTHISLRVAVPRHAFRWRFTVAIAAALPLRTRRELLCATAASGDVSNLEHALEVTGLDLGAAATATALLAAAACAEPPGGMAVTAFLLHRMGRSQQHQQDTRSGWLGQLCQRCHAWCSSGSKASLVEVVEPALCAAAAAGWKESCALLLGRLMGGGAGQCSSADTEGHGEELIEAETSAQIPDIGRRQQQPLVLPTTIALSRHIGKAVLAALRGGHLPLAALLQEQQHQLHQGRRPQLQRLQSQAAMVEVAANTAAASGAAAGDGAMAATTGDEWAALLEAAAAGLALRPLQLVVLCGGDLRKATAWVQEQTAQMTDSELAAAAAAAAAAHTRQLATWQLSAVVSAAAGSLQAVGSWADKLDWLTTEPPRGLGFPRPAAAAVAVVASAGSGMEAAEVALQRLQWLRGAGYPLDPRVVVGAAARRSDLRLLEALLRDPSGHVRPGREAAYAAAAAAARTAVLPPPADATDAVGEMEGAYGHGQVACGMSKVSGVPALRLLHKYGCAIEPYGTLLVAAESGDLAAVRWLLTGQQDEQEAPEEGGEHNRGGATTTSPVASQVRLDAEVMGAAASSGA